MSDLLTQVPANALEEAVHDAPPVVVQLEKTEDQLRKDALQTMTYLEAARAEKGNFCLTLGEGDGRAVLLVSPVAGIQVVDSSGEGGTRTDYVLFTAKGPRRISFKQIDINLSPYPAEKTKTYKTYNDREAKEEKELKEIIDRLAIKGEVDLKDSVYRERVGESEDIGVYFYIGIPNSKLNSDHFYGNYTRYKKNGFPNWESSGVVIDEATPLQALANSLYSVQSPIQARVSEAQAQIQSVNAIKRGLK